MGSSASGQQHASNSGGKFASPAIRAVAIGLYLNPLWKPIASSIIARIG
jgi:hypothetical protein